MPIIKSAGVLHFVSELKLGRVEEALALANEIGEHCGTGRHFVARGAGRRGES